MDIHCNILQKVVSCIFNKKHIDISQLLNEDMCIFYKQSNIIYYDFILKTLISLKKKYYNSSSNYEIIIYAIENNEENLLLLSNYKIFYIGENIFNGRKWIYRCEIDDYNFIIENKIKNLYSYLIFSIFNENNIDCFKIDDMDHIHYNKSINKYEELKTNLETIINNGEYVKNTNENIWQKHANIIKYAKDNNEMDILVNSDYVIYRIGEYFVLGREWIYMSQIKTYYEFICDKIKEYYKYSIQLDISAAITIAYLRV